MKREVQPKVVADKYGLVFLVGLLFLIVSSFLFFYFALPFFVETVLGSGG